MALNANNVPQTGGGATPDAVEAGNYPARVVQVIDLGVQPQRPFQGKEKPPVQMIRVVYELTSEFMENDDGTPDVDRPRWIGEDFPLYSLNQDRAKSTLRYKALDPGVQYGGDWSQLLAKECTLTVVQNTNTKTGKVYANVGGISPPMKGLVIDELKSDPVAFDMDSPDMEVFEALPDWLKEKITSALNYSESGLAQAKGESAPPPPAPEQSNVNPDLPV